LVSEEFEINESELIATTESVQNTPIAIEEIEEVKVEKRYVLEDFEAKPTIGKSSTPEVKQEEVEDELQFEVKTKSVEEIEVVDSQEVNPLNLTISQLKKKSDERREKMKGFNYKFKNQLDKNIDEIERVPAYLRKGVDVAASSLGISKEKTILNSEANKDDLNLNSNNSYLHDNVD